ncbi:hypothetical protein [Streptomyces sp. NPDC000410]|uniref:isochorismatase family protein n=1 Tax=Streptomyces sp. NPDC000410 TaxID=3154254 RepID=UPI0033341A60
MSCGTTSSGRDQLILIGCVLTCAGAFMHGIQPFLVADAAADFDSPTHLAALRSTAARCGLVTDAARAVRTLTQ